MSAQQIDRGKTPVNQGQGWSEIMEEQENNGVSNSARPKVPLKQSWAQMLGSNLPASLNKNVLEIVLEKDDRGGFNVGESDCAKAMWKLGIDARPGVKVE